MTIQNKAKILLAHSVPYYIAGCHIFVDSMIGGTALFEVVEDATTWSKKKLYSWLGY